MKPSTFKSETEIENLNRSISALEILRQLEIHGDSQLTTSKLT